MKTLYEDFVARAGHQLAELFWTHEDNVAHRARLLDAELAEITRSLSLVAMQEILERARDQEVKKNRAAGLTIQENPMICFNTIFGRLSLHSPYLWKKGQSAKPVRDVMGVRHHGRSETVNRALSDFGSEDSFGQAAQRFAEHYHYPVSSSTVNRVTHQVAQEAQAYVAQQLAQAAYSEAGATPPADRVHDLVIELDGCQIRTATFEPVEEPDGPADREEPERRKVVRWQEVRIGLARGLEASQKTYVGQHGPYADVSDALFQAAILEGMSPETAVTAVSDGAIGLREALDARFPDLLFILDHKHLKDQLYDTAEGIGVASDDRPDWVTLRLEAISRGEVDGVIQRLRDENTAAPHPRMTQFLGYLTRFADAVDYESFHNYGYPIGSGEVESAHRSVPQKRLKVPGACWHPESVNPMVALRVLRANGRWNAFWKARGQIITNQVPAPCPIHAAN
jgi:hypothetical protein